MLMTKKFLSLMLGVVFSWQLIACGNVSRESLQKNALTSPIGRITFTNPVAAPGDTQASNLQYGACNNLQVYSGNSVANAQFLQGAAVCKSTNTPGYVKINTPQITTNTKVCVFPVDASNNLYQQACVYTSGAVDVSVGITNAASAYVVIGSDENAFLDYVNGMANNPSMSYGSL